MAIHAGAPRHPPIATALQRHFPPRTRALVDPACQLCQPQRPEPAVAAFLTRRAAIASKRRFTGDPLTGFGSMA